MRRGLKLDLEKSCFTHRFTLAIPSHIVFTVSLDVVGVAQQHETGWLTWCVVCDIIPYCGYYNEYYRCYYHTLYIPNFPIEISVRCFVSVSPFWWIILCLVVQIVVIQSSEFISSRLKFQHNSTNLINECNNVLSTVSHPLIYLIIMTYFDGLSHKGFVKTIEMEKHNTFM